MRNWNHGNGRVIGFIRCWMKFANYLTPKKSGTELAAGASHFNANFSRAPHGGRGETPEFQASVWKFLLAARTQTMTTTVRVEAHCGDDTEVQISIDTPGSKEELFRISNGESVERHVHDDRSITIKEVPRD